MLANSRKRLQYVKDPSWQDNDIRDIVRLLQQQPQISLHSVLSMSQTKRKTTFFTEVR